MCFYLELNEISFLQIIVTCLYVVSVFNLKIDGMARNGNGKLCIRHQIKKYLERREKDWSVNASLLNCIIQL
jgi:hypothetical protein